MTKNRGLYRYGFDQWATKYMRLTLRLRRKMMWILSKRGVF